MFVLTVGCCEVENCEELITRPEKCYRFVVNRWCNLKPQE
jgi:hypothetical protein